MPTGSIPEFLAWAASSAGLVAIASWIAERLRAFQMLTAKGRQLVMIAVVVAIPQIVLVLTKVVPDSAWATLQPYWQSLVTSIVVLTTLTASELAHKADKRNRNGGSQ
jgi:hypothetical protein